MAELVMTELSVCVSVC